MGLCSALCRMVYGNGGETHFHKVVKLLKMKKNSNKNSTEYTVSQRMIKTKVERMQKLKSVIFSPHFELKLIEKM